MIYGVGTDIVAVARVAQLVQRFGERFLTRVFAPEEVRYCLAQREPALHLAARFAAKEALVKALGGRHKLNFADIVVARDASGRPSLTYPPAADLPPLKTHLTLAHEKEYATAMVVVEKE